MTANDLSSTGRMTTPMAALCMLLLMLSGCAASGVIRPVQPADVADIHFQCRLRTGEMVAATETVPDAERKAKIFVAKKEAGPVSMAVVRPDEPLPERQETGSLDAEIMERLMRKVAGMKEGEKRRVELTAEMIKPLNEQSGIARLSRVRTRPKEMKMPRSEYEARARKAPEVGQSLTLDPAFPGQVVSVTDRDVVIRFSAKLGSVIETPFGSGRIREEGQNYKVDIDAREGSLVRTGKRIGRIVKVDDQVIVVDYRHPFGFETLVCDVTIDKVKDRPAKKDGAAEK